METGVIKASDEIVVVKCESSHKHQSSKWDVTFYYLLLFLVCLPVVMLGFACLFGSLLPSPFDIEGKAEHHIKTFLIGQSSVAEDKRQLFRRSLTKADLGSAQVPFKNEDEWDMAAMPTESLKPQNAELNRLLARPSSSRRHLRDEDAEEVCTIGRIGRM